MQKEKNKDKELHAVEIFKEFHTSKKKGMTDEVKQTVVSAYK
jgi:hypothetical protein